MDPLKCACVDTDARDCYDLRYYGHAPAYRYTGSYDDELEADDQECPCTCHDQWESDCAESWESVF
jgi:hypothetical protein